MADHWELSGHWIESLEDLSTDGLVSVSELDGDVDSTGPDKGRIELCFVVPNANLIKWFIS